MVCRFSDQYNDEWEGPVALPSHGKDVPVLSGCGVVVVVVVVVAVVVVVVVVAVAEGVVSSGCGIPHRALIAP